MTTSGQATDAPRRRELLRRLEVQAAAGLFVAVALGGFAYTAGLTRAPDGDPEAAGRAFRPLVADFQGAVEVRPLGAPAWRPLTWSDAFSEGDRLRTGPDATCDVLLTWGTGFRVTPGSELAWTKLASDGRWADVELSLSRGEVLASLDALPDGSRFVVVTPHSRTRVKGTVLTVQADEEEAKTVVLEGVVEVVDRVDPNRRVDVTAGEEVRTGAGADDGPRPLSLEDRARLLGELAAVDAGIRRLSPAVEGDVEASKGRLEIRADAPAARPAAAAGDDAGSGDALTQGDRAEVAKLLRAGIALLDRGQVEQALGLCTGSFRAVIWGDSARRAGAPQEFAREQGDSRAILARDEVRSRILLGLELKSLDVVVDGDVAYGNASVLATARSLDSAAATQRNFVCTARCLRGEDGRWRVDLATASEEAGR
jgi:hypothetical protein